MERRQNLHHKMFTPRNEKIYALCLVILCCIISSPTKSQSFKNKIPKNTIYVELLGSAPIVSLNYGRFISLNKKNKISTDVGLEFAPYFTSKLTAGVSPQVSYMHGSINNVTVGIGYFYDFYWHELVPFPKVGYCYVKKGGGLMIKAEITPLFMYFKPKTVIFPWAGVGIGWNF